MATTKVKAKTLAGEAAQLVQVGDLTGGVDLRRTPSLLASNRARTLRNWSLEEPGALRTYPGYVKRSTTSLGSRRCQGGARVYLTGVDPFMLAADNGDVYKPSDAGVWGASVLGSRHATNQIYFPFDRTLVAVFDGSTTPQKSVDGSTWTQMGITAPASAPTASAVSGGSLVDAHTYEVSYSYLDTGLSHESNESATVTQAASGSNLTVRVTVTGSSDSQVDEVAIYCRDVTAGETVRRRVGTMADPAVTGTYDITANSWSAGLEAPTDHDVATAYKFGVTWKNRWWGVSSTVGYRLHFTQIFQPQSWPTLYYIDIPFTSGDEIAAIIPLGDTLIVFGHAQVFLIIGQTSLDFEVRPSAGAVAGALGPRAVCVIESGVIHAADNGVFIFDGATDRLLSWDIDPAWMDLVDGTSAANLAKVGVVYHEARKEVHVLAPRLYPIATPGEWILDLGRTKAGGQAAWTSTTRSLGGYILWNGPETTTGNRGRLWSWALTTAELYEEATGTTADGNDLVCEYEGPALASGLQMARWIDLYGEYQPAAGTLSLEVLVDASSIYTGTLTIGSNLSVYGTGLYGTATYAGTGRRLFSQMLPLTAEGRTIVLRTIYTGTASFTHYTYAFGVVPEALPRGIAPDVILTAE